MGQIILGGYQPVPFVDVEEERVKVQEEHDYSGQKEDNGQGGK